MRIGQLCGEQLSKPKGGQNRRLYLDHTVDSGAIFPSLIKTIDCSDCVRCEPPVAILVGCNFNERCVIFVGTLKLGCNLTESKGRLAFRVIRYLVVLHVNHAIDDFLE